MTINPAILVECKSCRGTGIYRGFAEANGVGVVCASCNGTGAQPLEYVPFAGRKLRKDVELVFATNPGFGLSTATRGGKFGEPVAYAEWLNGAQPTPPPESD